MRRLPLVSVIIPSYNSEAFITQCLERILEQTYPRERYEVLVVDNAATDHSAEIIKSFPVKYLYEAQPGPAAARNAGIRAAKGDYLLFIDADCLAEQALIEEHVQTHLLMQKTEPLVKAVGGGIDGINRNYWAWCDHFCSWYLNHPKLPPRFEARHLPTANLSIEKSILEVTGLFDEKMRFGEDSVFCKELREHGYKLYFQPQARLAHLNRTSFRYFMAHAREWARIGAHTPQETIGKQPRQIKNPWLALLYSGYYFAYRFGELAYSWLLSGEWRFLLCLPGIILNKLYFGFSMLKSRLVESKAEIRGHG